MTQDNRRYEAMPSHHPEMDFMIWDYYENQAMAYSYSKDFADQIAIALNAGNRITWDGRGWVDGTQNKDSL